MDKINETVLSEAKSAIDFGFKYSIIWSKGKKYGKRTPTKYDW